MRARHLRPTSSPFLSTNLFAMAAAGILPFVLARSASAQNVDFSPAALGNQRSAIILKATHAPISDVEAELNRLAVMSERCRVESGSKSCGLSDKPLETNSLDERYAYYVRTPMEAHARGHQAKVDKHNWESPPPPPR